MQTFFLNFFVGAVRKECYFFPLLFRLIIDDWETIQVRWNISVRLSDLFFCFFFRLLLRSPTTVITASNHRAHPKPRRAPFSLVSGVSAKVVRRAKLPQLI